MISGIEISLGTNAAFALPLLGSTLETSDYYAGISCLDVLTIELCFLLMSLACFAAASLFASVTFYSSSLFQIS